MPKGRLARMHSEIPTVVVDDLQRLGLEPLVADADTVKARLFPFDWINRLHWNEWNRVTGIMERDPSVYLARGLVRAEKMLGWSGGSVAASIWVFRMVQRRFPQEADALAEWMLANSDNPWVPFGTNRGDARSLAELEQHLEAKNARRRSSEAHAELQRHLRQVTRRRMEALLFNPRFRDQLLSHLSRP
jgi:hypothetical protein